MFSAYWEEAHKTFFDGISLLTPVVHSHIDMSTMLEFQTKPMAAFYNIASGIPSGERPCCKSYSLKDYMLHSLQHNQKYCLLLKSQIWWILVKSVYMATFSNIIIGNLRKEHVPRFLRFTTGSLVVLSLGLGHRPIAHTCGCTLELASTYVSY